jgi:hypothetical protein
MDRREFIHGSLAGIASTSLAGSQDVRARTPTDDRTVQRRTQTFADSDIRKLSQHFDDADGNIAPWIFVPKDNIREISTAESLGIATIWPSNKGKDIKGILEKPVRINEYPLPWEFQLGMVQNFGAMANIKSQSNYAIGLNVALTFSDASVWPEDRTLMPPDTHIMQLLVVHLSGLAQYTDLPQANNYFVWGRGDLHHSLTGDWRVPFIWIGDGACYAGPASNGVYFRFVVRGPGLDKGTSPNLAIGIKFDAGHGWNMRNFDTSQWGKVTGIWEIGPIISCDRWIPEVLCPNLPILRGPEPLALKDDQKNPWVPVYSPAPLSPNNSFEQYVDYCVFMRSRPIPFEEMSDDFDIPGYLGQWVSQDQSTIAETYSNPGNLTLTLWGCSLATGIAPVGGDYMNLSYYKPPWEIEICFAAEDTGAWNWFMNFLPITKSGRTFVWHPGVQYVPQRKKHYYINASFGNYSQGDAWGTTVEHGKNVFYVSFEKDVPESILAHKPLYMLIQWIDLAHVRTGFRANRQDAWYLSNVYDYSRITGGEELGDFGQMDWSTSTGRTWGGPSGSRPFQKILIDYIHYRYGLSV